MVNDNITRALVALHMEINQSNLGENEKAALNHLVDKLIVFYVNHYNEIMKYDENIKDRKMTILTTLMTDYIVSINDTVEGKNDAFCISNMIYKDINYDDGKGQFKKKRI